MMIHSIKWHGRYSDRVFNGKKLGEDYICNKATVTPIEQVYTASSRELCKEIIEESLTTYLVKFHDGVCLRIFNPIEVEFEEGKNI